MNCQRCNTDSSTFGYVRYNIGGKRYLICVPCFQGIAFSKSGGPVVKQTTEEHPTLFDIDQYLKA